MTSEMKVALVLLSPLGKVSQLYSSVALRHLIDRRPATSDDPLDKPVQALLRK